MMQDKLFKQDLSVLKELEKKDIQTGSLKTIFSKINQNQRFEQRDKEYLKKILVDNINNAYYRKHHDK